MSRIGIITLVKVNNYGAELQAFATQKVIELLGYDSEIIDYPYYKDKRYKLTKGSRPVFSFSFKDKILEFLYPKYVWVKTLFSGYKENKQRVENFNLFHKLNTKFSKEYITAESLYQGMDYDAYIVGSDQVWNPYNYTSLDPYFLKFAPADKKRISYASSIGVSSIPSYAFNYYKEGWQSFDSISVREENAVKIVKDISGKDAKWVLDPTLLLDLSEWRKVSSPVPGVKGNYLLIYEITPCPYIKDVAKAIAAEKHLCIIRINADSARKEPDSEILNIRNAGPSEFVWLFDHASFVVTNSFHGTAFSINMNKEFLVVTPSRKNNNSRQKSLLGLFDLTSRLIQENQNFQVNDLEAINYYTVNTKLETERAKCIDFLKSSIDG